MNVKAFRNTNGCCNFASGPPGPPTQSSFCVGGPEFSGPSKQSSFCVGGPEFSGPSTQSSFCVGGPEFSGPPTQLPIEMNDSTDQD